MVIPWKNDRLLMFFSNCYQFAGLSEISISQDIPVEGEITIPMRSRIREFDSSTLNESVQNTIVS